MTLNALPKQLDEAYQVTLERIGSQSSALASQGMEVLKWTFLAERQLTIQELRHALATVASTADSLDTDDLPFEKSLIDCCYGLVVFDRETTSVRLVHKSLHDFFEKKHGMKRLFEEGHREIAHTCLKYMSFRDSTIIAAEPTGPDSELSEFDSELLPPVPNRDAVWSLLNHSVYADAFYKPFATISPHTQKFPLLNYAIHFWGEHARKQINQEIADQVIKFLLKEEDIPCISRNLLSLALEAFSVWDCLDTDSEYEKFPSKKITSALREFSGLHLAAHFGLHQTAKTLISERGNLDINSKIFGQAPLLAAATRGHETVVRLLLESDGIMQG